MSKQVFVADTILTAQQLNDLQANDYNQTVSTKTASYTLVAADKGTRVVMNSASATTITVNTSLFSAGDTLILQNISSGVSTVTAGTATVSSAGPLAIPQNGSGLLYFTSAGVSLYYPSAVTATAGALTLVKTQTIGTTVSSVAMTDAFSALYDSYFVTVSGGLSSAQSLLTMIFTGSAASYYRATVNVVYSGGAGTFIAQNNDASFTDVGTCRADGLFAAITLNHPFLTKPTYGSCGSGSTANTAGKLTFLYHDAATSFSGLTISPSSGTLTGGTIRVYGYATSQDYMPYKIQIDDEVRNATPDESAAIDAQRAQSEAQDEAQVVKAAARQTVLDKLGLTADEAQALLG